MRQLPLLRVLLVVVMLLSIVGGSVAVTPEAVAQDSCPSCEPVPTDCVTCGPADETPQERRERIRAEIRAQVEARIAEARTRFCTSLPWARVC